MKKVIQKKDIDNCIKNLKNYYLQAVNMNDDFLASNIMEMLQMLGVSKKDFEQLDKAAS